MARTLWTLCVHAIVRHYVEQTTATAAGGDDEQGERLARTIGRAVEGVSAQVAESMIQLELVDDASVSLFLAMPSLETLSLKKIPHVSIEALTRAVVLCSNLCALDAYCPTARPPPLHFALHEPSSLSVQSAFSTVSRELGGVSRVNDAFLARLARSGAARSLERLDLTKSKLITDNGLAHLRSCTRLRSLVLSHCFRLTDECAVSLARVCPQLEVLELQLSELDVSHITRLSDSFLERLLFSADAIADGGTECAEGSGGIERRGRVLPSLTSLSLKATLITPKAIARFLLQREAMDRFNTFLIPEQHVRTAEWIEVARLCIARCPRLTSLPYATFKHRERQLQPAFPSPPDLALGVADLLDGASMPGLSKLSVNVSELTTGILDRLPSLTKLQVNQQRCDLADALEISRDTLSLRDGRVPTLEAQLSQLFARIRGAARPFDALTRLSLSTLASIEVLDGLTQLRQLESLQFKRATIKLPQVASTASIMMPVNSAEVERAGLVIEDKLSGLLASLGRLREFTWWCDYMPQAARPTLRLKINLSRLRRLTLRSAFIELVELECPELRRLGLFDAQLHQSLSWSSVASSTPRLRRLWFASDAPRMLPTERPIRSVRSAIGGWHCLKQLLVRQRGRDWITLDGDDMHLALRCIPHLDLGTVQASKDHMAALVCELSRLVSLRLNIPSLSVEAHALHNTCLTQLHLFDMLYQRGTLNLSGLPNLVEMRLSSLYNISEVVVVGLERLSIVEIGHCSAVSSVTVAGCPVLNSIGISEASSLERLSLEAPELERLRINTAAKLQTIEPLDLPECAYVALRGACQLTVPTLKRILERCTRLRHFELEMCIVNLNVVEQLVSESATRPRTVWSRGVARHGKVIDCPPRVLSSSSNDNVVVENRSALSG